MIRILYNFKSAISTEITAQLKDKEFGLMAVEEHFPEAFKALPEFYKSYSHLKFFIDEDGFLCAAYDDGESYWFNHSSNEWIGLESDPPESDTIFELNFD